MNEAYFFKNLNNLEELKKKTNSAMVGQLKKQKYIVLQNNVMSQSEFNAFCQSFRSTQNCIKNISYRLTMTQKYEYICISITSNESDFSILVNSSGYSYARIIAMVKKGK